MCINITTIHVQLSKSVYIRVRHSILKCVGSMYPTLGQYPTQHSKSITGLPCLCTRIIFYDVTSIIRDRVWIRLNIVFYNFIVHFACRVS